MQVRVVTLRYSEGMQGFPEEALRKATFGREVLGVEEHFFTYGNVPHLALVLTLGDVPGDSREWKRDPNAPNPEDELPEASRGAYRALKAWRNETAKAEGRPAYAIARNAQLAEIVRRAPRSLAALREIDGIGEGFCEKYGRKVLELARELAPTEETESVAGNDSSGTSRPAGAGVADGEGAV